MAKFILSAFADEAGDSLDAQIAALQRNGIGYIEPRAIDKKGVIFKTDEELKEILADDGFDSSEEYGEINQTINGYAIPP